MNMVIEEGGTQEPKEGGNEMKRFIALVMCFVITFSCVYSKIEETKKADADIITEAEKVIVVAALRADGYDRLLQNMPVEQANAEIVAEAERIISNAQPAQREVIKKAATWSTHLGKLFIPLTVIQLVEDTYQLGLSIYNLIKMIFGVSGSVTSIGLSGEPVLTYTLGATNSFVIDVTMPHLTITNPIEDAYGWLQLSKFCLVETLDFEPTTMYFTFTNVTTLQGYPVTVATDNGTSCSLYVYPYGDHYKFKMYANGIDYPEQECYVDYSMFGTNNVVASKSNVTLTTPVSAKITIGDSINLMEKTGTVSSGDSYIVLLLT